MAKANYTKVEGALNEGLLKIGVSRLLDITEAAILGYADQGRPLGQLLAALHYELKALKHQGIDPYEKLGIDKKDLKRFSDNPDSLTPEDLQKIKQLKEKIEAFKKELEAKSPPASDEDVVNTERRKHINKRFNVNEKWLPLH